MNVQRVTIFQMLTIHARHPSSIAFVLERCDLCSTKEQVAVLFASVEEIHTPTTTSKARVKVGREKIQIRLLSNDHFEHV